MKKIDFKKLNEHKYSKKELEELLFMYFTYLYIYSLVCDMLIYKKIKKGVKK